MSSFPKEDLWEKFLENKKNDKRTHIVLPSPRVSVRPRNDDLEQCFIENLEISNLKNEISALERRNAELIVGIGKPQKKTHLSKLPTLSNLRQQTNGANANSRDKAYAEHRQAFSDAYKLLHPNSPNGGNNKNNKNKYSKKVNSKKSRRFRKHKRRSAARRGTRQ
jgi:hypothetical protein